MSRRMLVKVTAPTVAIGLLLLGACLVSAWYITQMQSNMAIILKDNVAGLRAAQELEISARQLQLHCLQHLMAPADRQKEQAILEDEKRFEHWLEQARLCSFTQRERELVDRIRTGYELYRGEFEELLEAARHAKSGRKQADMARLNPLHHVIDPCRELLDENKRMMHQTAAESEALSGHLRLAMLLLGVGGPLAGLISGYGIARGLSRSLYQLSVRVQDVSQQLEQDVASVSLATGGDLQQLDRQLGHIVNRVEEVMQRLQGQQRELLRAQQLSAVGQLAACVAHEIRNPLTAVKMLVEVALRGRNPKPLTADDLKVIHDEVVRLEQTVQNLLDFARLPAPKRSVCDLREVVVQAGELVRARAGQQDVQMSVDCPPDPVLADVDRGQLCTVLVNLFLNALDAMPDGGRLEAELEDEAGGQVRLRIADSGGGIAAKVLPDLFTPFTSGKPTGTGLGLSISRRIVEEHGGAIVAGNRPPDEGLGACFVITLPAFRAKAHGLQPVGLAHSDP